MTILDSTTEGYTITWEYGIPPELDKNSMMFKVAEIMEKMEFVYKTDDVGIFTELVNWEQIRDFYIGMLKLQLRERKLDEKNQKALDEVLATFQKKEVIESMAIKEIQLLHAPYGLVFSTKDTSVSTELFIPLTEERMPAIQSWGIAETDDNDNFRLQITQRVDSAGVIGLLESIFKKYSSEQNIEKEKLSKELASFKFDDIAEYRFIQSTGWISEYVCTRKTGTGNQVQIETYKMKLREK